MKHLWTVAESDTKIYANNWPNFIEACPKRDLIDQLNDSYLYSCISCTKSYKSPLIRV